MAGSSPACQSCGRDEKERVGSLPCIVRGRRCPGAEGSLDRTLGWFFLPFFPPYLPVAPGPSPYRLLSPPFLLAVLSQPGHSFHIPSQVDSR